MQHNIDFASLWKKQEVPPADREQLLKGIRKLRRASLNRTLFLNISLSATAVAIVLIVVFFKPQLGLTKAGIVFILSSFLLPLTAANRMVPLYRSLKDTVSNTDYLNTLRRIKQREQLLQTRTMSWYFILLSSGIFLYMYEYARKMELLWAFTAYGSVALWIALNWWVMRPRTIKKNNRRLDALLKQLSDQDYQHLL